MCIPKPAMVTSIFFVLFATFWLLWNIQEYSNALRPTTINSGRSEITNPGDIPNDKHVANQELEKLSISIEILETKTHEPLAINALVINQTKGEETLNDNPVKTFMTPVIDDTDVPMTQEIDIDEDGITSDSVLYEYNHNGSLVGEVFDRNGDGIPEASLNYFYEKNGNVEIREFDFDGDGLTNSIYKSKFDSNTNTLRQELDIDGDGVTDKIYISEYNTKGYRIRQQWDFNGDDVIDEAQLYEYYDDDERERSTRDLVMEDKITGEIEMFISFMSINNELVQSSR